MKYQFWTGPSETHTTTVQEDMSSVNTGWHFLTALISLLSDNRLKTKSLSCNLFYIKINIFIINSKKHNSK
jgi:hypothetical protein